LSSTDVHVAVDGGFSIVLPFVLPMCNNQLFYHCATFIKDYWLEHLQIKQYSAKMLRFLILIITNYNKNNLV